MKKLVKLRPPVEVAYDEKALDRWILSKVSTEGDPVSIILKKRNLDARGKRIKINIEAEVYFDETPIKDIDKGHLSNNVENAPPIIIVGSGPAGLFAAMKLIEKGLKPIVLERGRDVQGRRRDLVSINRFHQVDPDSNYCFGEGGAGTYSDGKLYTRSKKRGNVKQILELLVFHGAGNQILYDAHPHIGTNKLPKIVKSIRESIVMAGGEVHFETRVEDLVMKNGEVLGVVTQHGDHVLGLGVILAAGHSARDIFRMLAKRHIRIELKPFALGLRVEHPQELIDEMRYHNAPERKYLPPSSYSVVSQSTFDQRTRGVFSFCMCPGGFIVPSATAQGEVVVNGMSPSRRNSKFANSGIVVALEEEDIRRYGFNGVLGGMEFQQKIEKEACDLAGGSQRAPAQRLNDFLCQKISSDLPVNSYQPGLESVRLQDLLPSDMIARLRYGINSFGKKMRRFVTNDAVLVGVESRTSSPVRITRDKDSCEHVEVKRLYPCGEGAGYAGGIVSAALDGIRCAELLANKYKYSSN